MGIPHDVSGERFGRLVAQRCERRDWRHSYWQCVCDCGATHTTTLNALRRGLVVSCGCYRREFSKAKATTHGRTNTTEHRIWSAMKRRCTNPNVPEWKDYGKRGISVCDRWMRSFEDFFADMGSRPAGLTLDRINHNGNYEPSNCRWATYTQQANNRRGNHVVNVAGVAMTFKQACFHLGVPASTASTRISRGWPEHLWFAPKGTRRSKESYLPKAKRSA